MGSRYLQRLIAPPAPAAAASARATPGLAEIEQLTEAAAPGVARAATAPAFEAPAVRTPVSPAPGAPAGLAPPPAVRSPTPLAQVLAWVSAAPPAAPLPHVAPVRRSAVQEPSGEGPAAAPLSFAAADTLSWRATPSPLEPPPARVDALQEPLRPAAARSPAATAGAAAEPAPARSGPTDGLADAGTRPFAAGPHASAAPPEAPAEPGRIDVHIGRIALTVQAPPAPPVPAVASPPAAAPAPARAPLDGLRFSAARHHLRWS